MHAKYQGWPLTEYSTKESSAKMPNSCMGRYVRVGLLETLRGAPENAVRMISEHARGVLVVVRVWERCHSGLTERCAAARAEREAEELGAQREELVRHLDTLTAEQLDVLADVMEEADGVRPRTRGDVAKRLYCGDERFDKARQAFAEMGRAE